jgi:hypothetical protein
LLQPFCEWMEDGLDLAIGETLFAGHRPANAPDLCTVVLERVPGYTNDTKSALREKSLQIVTRGPRRDYFAARDEAHRVYAFLVNRIGLTAVAGWFCHIGGNEPYHMGADDRERHEFSTNVVVRAQKEA